MRHQYLNYNTTDFFNEVLAEIKSSNQSEAKYTEADLVSFGKYLLSENRREFFKKNSLKGHPLQERLKDVNDSDILKTSLN